MLEIHKFGFLNFFHYWNGFEYSASDLVITFDGNILKLRATNGRVIFLKDGWNFTDVRIYDDTVSGGEESFGSVIALQQRLIDLGHPAYAQQGTVVVPENFSDLNDVAITAPATGQVPVFNEASGKWENNTPAGGGDMLKSVYDPSNIENDAFASNYFKQPTASKTTPIDADEVNIWDSVASIYKKLSWSNIKATLKAYFDTLYAPIGGGAGTVTSVAVSGSDGIEIDSGSPITTSGTIALGLNKTTTLAFLNVEDGADVTDATNVNAAGATMNTDITLAGNGYFLDEDNFASDSATKVPSQQSVKAYITALFKEENLKGIALYNATTTGAVNIDCATFVSWRRILTGNTTLTFTSTPASGESFTRYMDINSTAAETLAFGNATHIIGTYDNDTSRNKLTIELSNFPTVGLVITVFINPVV